MNRTNRARLWNHLRLVVVDTETTAAPGSPDTRVVSAAAVSCVAGRIAAIWSEPLIDPERSIEAVSASVHGITDADVATAPRFAAVAPVLAAVLYETPWERVVLVAHNAPFDLGVLRSEFARVGAALPDLPVLDTMGRLPSLAGVGGSGSGLDALLASLNLSNPKPHDALSDATATAQAAIALLNAAADAGYTSLVRLLAATADGRTSTIRAATAIGLSVPREPDRSPEHLAAHATPLPHKPGRKLLADWLAALDEDADLRCSLTTDRVLSALAPIEVVLPALVRLVEDRAAAGKPEPVATLVGVLTALLPSLPPATTGQPSQATRTAARHLDDRLAPLLDPLGRCREHPRCPDCREGLPCPLDIWRLALAAHVLMGRSHDFLNTTGRDAGNGPYVRLRATNAALADTAMRAACAAMRDAGDLGAETAAARLAVNSGCADPEVGETVASAMAAGGRASDLEAGITLADRILGRDAGSTDDAWRSLAICRARLAGRRRRLDASDRDIYDDNGVLVRARRHHPASPRRSRPPRFHPDAWRDAGRAGEEG